jgi:hypothetical protein
LHSFGDIFVGLQTFWIFININMTDKRNDISFKKSKSLKKIVVYSLAHCKLNIRNNGNEMFTHLA